MSPDHKRRHSPKRMMITTSILGIALTVLTSTSQPALASALPQQTASAMALARAGSADNATKIIITPEVDTATVGDARLFTASAVDNQNNPVPITSVNWQVSPTLGSIQSSGALTALVQMGSQPGFYPNAIVATAGAGVTPGSASVVLQAGPPASVIVSPASATLAINATQTFTAAVFDKFGNALNLGVTWLPKEGVATIESFTANSAVLRAGTQAGIFADGLRAVQSGAEGVAAITVLAGPPAGLTLSASPNTLTTNGRDNSTITAQVVDAYGNGTGAGAQINLSVDSCAGTCTLLPNAGTADAQGRFVASLQSTYTSPTQALSSQIKVSGVMQAGATTANASVIVPGSFMPARLFIGILARDYPINNHTSCTALRVSPPAVVNQAPAQAFNLYRFTAENASYTVALSNYASTGQLLLYRVNNDQCASNGTISVTFVRSTPIGNAATQVTLSNLFEGGKDYLLAVQTTGATSEAPYRLEIRP